MRKSIVLMALLGALAVTAGIPFASPAVGDSPNLNPRILPINSTPYGKTYGEWSGAWWQWAYSISPPENPVLDLTGEYAAQGQSGPVWFLAGTFGGTADRTVVIPAGKALFIPIYNYVWVNFYNPDLGIEIDLPWSAEQDAAVREYLKYEMDNAPALACEIDGVSVADIKAFRCATAAGQTFTVTLPDYNVWDNWLVPDYASDIPAGVYGPCVTDGYCLMLAPLKAGKHTIHFSAEGFLDVTYHITVK